MSIDGLRSDDFQIEVDKVSQKIVSFLPNSGPASIGIVIDDSGSMFEGRTGANRRSELMKGIARFIEVSDPASEYFTVLFNAKLTRVEDWSTDPTVITTALMNITSQGATPLYDALSQATKKVETGSHQKDVLILIGDGQDNVSKTSFNRLRDQLKNSDAVLYCIGYVGDSNAGSSLGMEGQGVLDELAAITGGRAYFPRQNKDSDYAEAVTAIAADLQSQYQVVFVPDPPSTKKDWRKVKVKVSIPADASRKKVIVRSRQTFR